MAPFSTNINSHEYPVRPDLQSKSCLVVQLLVPHLPQSSVSSSLDLVDIFLILPPFLLLQPLFFILYLNFPFFFVAKHNFIAFVEEVHLFWAWEGNAV